MFQRILAARYASPEARREAPQPDAFAANAVGKTTEVARLHAQEGGPPQALGPADRYRISIENSKREIEAVRYVLLPALLKALRSKEPALERQMAISNASMQLRYMLMRASQQIFALEKAATYTDPMLVYLRREVDVLASRSARLGAYQNREHLLPRGYQEETKPADPVRSSGRKDTSKQETRLRLGGNRTPSVANVTPIRARGTVAPPVQSTGRSYATAAGSGR